MSSSTASCFKNNGYTTVIARGWYSYGEVDKDGCSSLKAAMTAGIAHRDVYFFPCVTCSTSAASQLASMVSYYKSNCSTAWSGRVWLDVEAYTMWTGSTTANRIWYQQLVDACKSTAGVSCGIYSSYYNWQDIFGSTSYSYGNSLPLWYAHYDSMAGFSDFNSFGGWTKPWGKQYIGDTTTCGLGIDVNYIPTY